MRIKRGIRRVLTGTCVAAGILTASNVVCGQLPCTYEVTAIIQAPKCPPFGFPPTIGKAITEPIDGGLPNVVGHYQSCVIGPDRAFLWIGNEDRFITLPMPPGTTRSYAVDISGSRIVGRYDNADLELGTTGFLYDFESDEFTSLGTLPGGNTSEAHGINALGQIAGYWGNNIIGPWQTFMWEDGVMNDLGPSIGGANNRGLDINEEGAITGWWQREENGDRIAFVWQDRVMTDLGPIPGGFTSEGRAINTVRQVVGVGQVEGDGVTLLRAFLWENDQFTDLGTLPGFDRCAAVDVNDSTTIIGGCDQSDKINNDHVFVWSQGVMVNLNDLVQDGSGVTIRYVSAINNSGQIAARSGYGIIAGVLLTPIDAPPGDLNGDCAVGVADLLVLLASWGACDDCGICPADLDGNCVVGASDLLSLLANWS